MGIVISRSVAGEIDFMFVFHFGIIRDKLESILLGVVLVLSLCLFLDIGLSKSVFI